MLSKRTTLFVFVLLAVLIACNLPSSVAVPTLTTATPSNPSETTTPAPEQGETQTQAPGDQPGAPPPTVGVNPTVPGSTSPPTESAPVGESVPTTPPGGVIVNIMIYGRDPIYKGGFAIIGWDLFNIENINIEVYGVDDYTSGVDYDPARLSDLTPLKIYEMLPPTARLSIYIPPDFSHTYMILAPLPSGYDVTDITPGSLAALRPGEPGPGNDQYDFSGRLEIRKFEIEPPVIKDGDEISLYWEVAGATDIKVVRLSEEGGILETLGANLDHTNYLRFPFAYGDVDQVSFMLIATNDTGDQVTQTVTSTTNFGCPFETTLYADHCPVSQATVEAAYQPFEHGFMVWRTTSSGDPALIYAVYDDGNWQKFEDTWVAGETFDVGETPPEGFYQPEHGFGKLWAAEAFVRDELGWATEPEIGYTASVETHNWRFAYNEGISDHITLPDGRVLHLETPWWID